MIEFLLAATLVLRDPPGDAVGAGDLVPPSAEQYRDVGSFDLLELQVLDAPMLALTVEMGALPNPAGLPNGFSNTVIDIYVDTAEGGAEQLLPGPEMRMPPGRGWEIALRITGDGATAYRAGGADEAVPSISYPVQVAAEDRVIRVDTPFERGEVQGVYAVTGVYDPFVASGWRAVSASPSPWAFASIEQRRPVIDLIAPDAVAQAQAIREGLLPTPRNRASGAMWTLLMVLGIVVAGVGLVLRRMVPARSAAPGQRGQDEGAAPVGSAPAAERAPATAGASSPSSSATLEPVSLPTFLPALPPPARPAAEQVGATARGVSEASRPPLDRSAPPEPVEAGDEAGPEEPEALLVRGEGPDRGEQQDRGEDAAEVDDVATWTFEDEPMRVFPGWREAENFDAFADLRAGTHDTGDADDADDSLWMEHEAEPESVARDDDADEALWAEGQAEPESVARDDVEETARDEVEPERSTPNGSDGDEHAPEERASAAAHEERRSSN